MSDDQLPNESDLSNEPMEVREFRNPDIPRQQTIIIRPPERSDVRKWVIRFLILVLAISVLANFSLVGMYQDYFTNVTPPLERFHSGSKTSSKKIALIKIEGTIMPPFTDRVRTQIKRAKKDKRVVGVLLSVDSPGGMVPDSHQIYRDLLELSEKKPVFVSMKRMAASGGLYVAMGAGPNGRIYAEPTTWTGSIGVIIPRYNAKELADKVGVEPESLKTGELKDALNPFTELTDKERKVWEVILDDAFIRFKNVIAKNRKPLDAAKVDALATGQVYTANQAVNNGLVDEIGYQDDAIADLKDKLEIKEACVITYDYPPTLLDALTGAAEANHPDERWRKLMEASVPRAMYFCSGLLDPHVLLMQPFTRSVSF